MSEDKNKPSFNKWSKEIINLALSLNQTQKVEDVLTHLKDRILIFFNAEAIRFFIADPASNTLYTKIKFEDVYEELRLPISTDSVVGYTAKSKNIVDLHDVRDQNALAKYPGLVYDGQWEKLTGIKVQSVLSVPLIVDANQLNGVIQVINGKEHPDYTRQDTDFLAALGNLLVSQIFQHTRKSPQATKFDLLLANHLVTAEEIEKAAQIARKHHNDPIKGDIVSILIENYNIDEKMMGASLSKYYLTDFFSFEDQVASNPNLFAPVNTKYLSTNFLVPISYENDFLTLVMDDPSNQQIIKEIKQSFGVQNCKLYVGLRKEILKHISRANEPLHSQNSIELLLGEMSGETEIESLLLDEDILNENAPTITKTVNRVILAAYEKGISDIHVEPRSDNLPTRIRFRQDGICFKFMEIPALNTNAVVNRIKVMAGLKLEERRFPQSGKIRLKYGDDTIELRVEITPTVGRKEDVVMRILASAQHLPIDDLNLSTANFTALQKLISKPYGIILAVGPTGSGKTTTLHSILSKLNTPQKKIWTAEDPVEITQDGLRQVQINYNIKPQPFDFSRAMRSFLRADPDIIMIGEMRDQETARIAIEASLTGHLVLSTLHTNSAPETLTRLVEMGMNPINLSDALLGVLAQRLVNTLCNECKESYQPDEAEFQVLREQYGASFAPELEINGHKKVTLFRPAGCPHCNGTGYKGRVGIHELLVGTPNIKRMIQQKAFVEDIRQEALKEGMRTLKMDGIQKVVGGQTDLQQVLRVCID